MNNSTNTIKDSVLEKIAHDRLMPTNKWVFRAQHAVLWVPGILVTVLGSFAIAGILVSILHAGWGYRSYTERTFVEFFSQVIPFLWVVSFALFATVVVKTLRLTARGYRYTTGMILLVSFIVSVFLGLGLFALDSVAPRGAPLVRLSAERAQKILWSDPLRGRVAGVLDIDGDTTFLTDTTGHSWRLVTSELADTELLVDERSVRILGEQLDADTFIVCMVLPWDLSPFSHGVGAPQQRSPLPAVPLGHCAKFAPSQVLNERKFLPQP